MKRQGAKPGKGSVESERETGRSFQTGAGAVDGVLVRNKMRT